MKITESQAEIISAFLSIVKEEKRQPSYADFVRIGISRDRIRTAFGGISHLQEYMTTNHSDEIADYYASLDDLFESNEDNLQDYSKFVITTAVADCPIHEGFMETLREYCAMYNAKLIIMPCESVTNSFETRRATFDPAVMMPDVHFLQEDESLNDNLTLCHIQISAKQIKPITGLQRIGARDGSYIFASPKQFLEYIPAGNSRVNNYSIMTPGACTLPRYYANTFVSKRLSYIAEHDHTLGAIIVEVENERYFHFRQIQADESGSFCDMGIQYHPNGLTNPVSVNVVFGDIHAASVDKDVLNTFLDGFSSMNVSRVFLHDVFDGKSINHHETTIYARTKRSMRAEQSLEQELAITYDVIDTIHKALSPQEVVIVKSNHDEFLDRYLQEGRYIDDPDNHYPSLLIAPAIFEDVDPLQHALDIMVEDTPSEWTFLSRNDSYKVGGVELGAHGDLGLNGAKSSLNSLEKIYGNAVVAHSHSGAIQRGIMRVGTLTKMDLGYNRGPSSWTHTCALVYENGQRQLVNAINGRIRA